MNLKIFSICFCFIFIIVLTGCASTRQPDTSLYGRGTHAGTLTLLRVDHSWRPDIGYSDDDDCDVGDSFCQIIGWRRSTADERCVSLVGADANPVDGSSDNCDPLRRFVPLRGKDDVNGLDIRENIVLDTEDINLTLNYAFIKYFNEAGANKPIGEIAMVISFDAGEDLRESFLVYSSQGQTFGSFLDFQDWIAVGPVKVKASSLSVRIVLIEMDQAENERAKQYIRSIAQVAPTLVPAAAGVVPILSSIAETIISQNVDDVLFDQRFTLKRVSEGEPVLRSPLLYGKYVAISQEDSLARNDAAKRTPLSTQPPPIAELRYDLDSDRLFRSYNYLPELLPPDPADVSGKPQLMDFSSTWGPIPVSKPLPLGPPSPGCAPISLQQDKINDEVATERRRRILGYSADGKIGKNGPWCTFLDAMSRIALDSVRIAPDQETTSQVEFQRALLDSQKTADGRYRFAYPVLDYPQAYSVLGQYALHTHLVFTIEESVGHAGRPYHERFEDYQSHLEQQIANAKDADEVEALAATLTASIIAQKKRDAASEWLTANREASDAAKACRLYNSLLPPDSAAALGNAYVYSKLYKVSGQIITTPAEAKAYIQSADGHDKVEFQDTAAGGGLETCSEKAS